MKVVLTGASGFLGGHVLAALGTKPIEVLALSRRQPGTELGPMVRWMHIDIEDEGASSVVMGDLPDVVVHLAWAGLPNYKSLHHIESALSVQYRFLAGLLRRGLPRLVVTGTCFEYGMQSGELHEGMNTDPRNSYALAKDSLRRQLELLREQRPFELTWARLFYMYGAGQPKTSLYAQWEAARDRGDKTFAMSSGDQLRDFLPVTTLSDIIAKLAVDAEEGGVVNVCSGRPRSVRSLVESWQAASGSDMTLDLGRYPYPDYEPMAFWGSTTRLDKLLGGVARQR